MRDNPSALFSCEDTGLRLLPATGGRDPLVVVWVRADDAGGAGPNRIELAVEAVGPSGARAGAVAAIRLGPRGVAILAVWPDAGIAGPA